MIPKSMYQTVDKVSLFCDTVDLIVIISQAVTFINTQFVATVLTTLQK